MDENAMGGTRESHQMGSASLFVLFLDLRIDGRYSASCEQNQHGRLDQASELWPWNAMAIVG